MKRFAKLLVLALSVVIIASLFVASSLAAEIVDPNTLQPGSDRVIFIKDAPRDENNNIIGQPDGDGTGSDASNPMWTVDHENFDPDADHPKWHLQTAFYQATEILAETGGTIVICGPVYFGVGESYGSGSYERDVYTAFFGDNVIKITSVYDGVDYRETAGAKIIIDSPAMLSVRGSSVWENVDIATAAYDRAITFGEYRTLIGEGVNCYPLNSMVEGIAQDYISLAAGHRYSGSEDATTNLTVLSGTYNYITGGVWGTVATQKMENANVNLTLGGTTKVLGIVSGTVRQKAGFSGNVNITINGGTYEGDINCVGATGMLNTDGKVMLKINGGDFKNAYAINQAAFAATNNLPAECTVDFSDWTGKKIDLAFANSIIADITDVKYPAGVTAEELKGLIENYDPSAPEAGLEYIESLIEGTGLKIGKVAENIPVIVSPTLADGKAITVSEFEAMIEEADVAIKSPNGVIGTGCRATIGEYILEIAVKGDIDGDGTVTVYDALMTQKAVTNNGSFGSNIREFAGDVDEINGTDSADVDAILAHVVGEMLIA
ncbi:MAG: hypothetical protein IJD37_04965 [Clostridia bacterium]|nr:hypothetical protein [Clostridia bacterium]